MSSRPHDRNASQEYCCAQYGHRGPARHRANLSHAAACDWLDANPFPCGGDVHAHLVACRDAVVERTGFVDPGTLMLIWSLLSSLWSFYQWLASEDEHVAV